MEIDICPRWLLAKLGILEQNQRHVALFVSTLLMLMLFPLVTHIPHFCLMRTVLGIPCPGCGVSHSVMAILRLNPVAAWRANPAGLCVASAFFFQIVARPTAVLAPRTSDLVSLAARNISNVALGCLLLVWISRVI